MSTTPSTQESASTPQPASTQEPPSTPQPASTPQSPSTPQPASTSLQHGTPNGQGPGSSNDPRNLSADFTAGGGGPDSPQ